jgi:hypothetical protein
MNQDGLRIDPGEAFHHSQFVVPKEHSMTSEVASK